MTKKRKLYLITAIALLLATIYPTMFFLMKSPDPGSDFAFAAVTLSRYNQLEKDMTYEKVTEIFGCEGTLQSQDGEKDDPDYTATYVWYGKTDDSKAVITFHGNLLGAKTNLGMTD